MKIILEIISGARRGELVELDQEMITLGRANSPDAPGKDVYFDHYKDTTASRNHCEIHYKDDGYYLVETAAKNKTFVNGVSAGDQRLKDGDVIQCGFNGPRVKV